MKQIHYVATLIVKRVEVEDGKPTVASTSYPATGSVPSRKVGDVITLTIRSAELEDLKGQLKDHLLVAKDDINVPLDNDKVTR